VLHIPAANVAHADADQESPPSGVYAADIEILQRLRVGREALEQLAGRRLMRRPGDPRHVVRVIKDNRPAVE